jgi:hypothetical protein
MLTPGEKVNFMTHLKYQHLNVDILFIGITAVMISLQGKEKVQRNFYGASSGNTTWHMYTGQAWG